MKGTRFFLQILGTLSLMLVLTGFGAMFFASHWMRIDDGPSKADFILPLAGDDERLITAAELYRQSFAPVVLVSRAQVLPTTRLDQRKWHMGYPKFTHEEFVQRLLGDLGVPPVAAIPFGNGHVSTVEEAEAFAAFLQGAPATVLLVTSPYHARRAKTIFQDMLPDCRITVTTTPGQPFPDNWWQDQRASTAIAMEFIKTLYYVTGNSFRSTDTSPTP